MKTPAPVATSLDACVRETLEAYFRDLRGTDPSDLHAMVLRTMEKPLLEIVMAKTDGNQSRAAEWLGINRNTLRRKLLEHRLAK